MLKELQISDLEQELVLFHQNELTKHKMNEYITKQDTHIKVMKATIMALRYDISNYTAKIASDEDEINSYK